MTRRRRGPLLHIFDILRSAREPVKVSHFQRAVNLDYRVALKYLPLLLERGLIKKVPYVRQEPPAEGAVIDKRTPHLYVVTGKGKVLVELFERIYDILGWSVQT